MNERTCTTNNTHVIATARKLGLGEKRNGVWYFTDDELREATQRQEASRKRPARKPSPLPDPIPNCQHCKGTGEKPVVFPDDDGICHCRITPRVRVCMRCGSHEVDHPSDGCSHFEIVEFVELHPATAHVLTDLMTARRTIEHALRCLHDAAYMARLSGMARILDRPSVSDGDNVIELVRKNEPTERA